MKFWKKGKPSTKASSSSTDQDVEKSGSRLSESHQMALEQPFGLSNNEKTFSCSIEYHLTIRLRYTTLSRRELSLLLDVLNYQAVHYGVNLTMMMAIYDLYFRLLGNKRDSKEIRENKIRLTVSVSELILKVLKNSDFSLSSEEIIELPSEVKRIIQIVGGLMSKRTYGSRYRSYRPEKFLEVRIVPVDIQFLTRNKDTSRYDSYCKGYGESHPSTHRSRTRPSAELDGSGESPAEVEENFLFNRCTDPIHVLSEFLLIWYENWEKKEK